LTYRRRRRSRRKRRRSRRRKRRRKRRRSRRSRRRSRRRRTPNQLPDYSLWRLLMLSGVVTQFHGDGNKYPIPDHVTVCAFIGPECGWMRHVATVKNHIAHKMGLKRA
jgi:hypothetical protein